MSRRVFLTLLAAPVLLLASGQSKAVSYSVSQTSSLNFASIQEACNATTDAINSSAGKVYTEFRYLSADKVDGATVKYTCRLQGLYKWDSTWRDLTSVIWERAKGCAPGASAAVRGAISSAIYSDTLGTYIVASRAPDSGCFDGCQYEAKSDKNSGCYLVKGSTTQGFCNYQVSGIGSACSSATLVASSEGDPLKKPNDTDDGSDTGSDSDSGGGTGLPPSVPDIDIGAGTGGSGSGSSGNSGGSSGSDNTNGSGSGGDSGSAIPGSGDGGDGTAVPGGSTGGGNGSGNGTDTGGSVGSGPTSTPCKGINFGESGCAEFGIAQTISGTLDGASKAVQQVQDSLWESYDSVQNQGNKTQEDAEQSLIQRFGSMLPTPGACVNPVMDFGWTVIAVDVCRYTFVKQLLSWMFASFTLYYVFRVMTSLGSNSEV